jgi:hypothetical protein
MAVLPATDRELIAILQNVDDVWKFPTECIPAGMSEERFVLVIDTAEKLGLVESRKNDIYHVTEFARTENGEAHLDGWYHGQEAPDA